MRAAAARARSGVAAGSGGCLCSGNSAGKSGTDWQSAQAVSWARSRNTAHVRPCTRRYCQSGALASQSRSDACVSFAAWDLRRVVWDPRPAESTWPLGNSQQGARRKIWLRRTPCLRSADCCVERAPILAALRAMIERCDASVHVRCCTQHTRWTRSAATT